MVVVNCLRVVNKPRINNNSHGAKMPLQNNTRKPAKAEASNDKLLGLFESNAQAAITIGGAFLAAVIIMASIRPFAMAIVWYAEQTGRM